MAFEDDKLTIINIVKANKCPDAQFIQDNANNYEQLAFMLFEFSKTFDCDPTYLDTLLGTIDDALLLSLDIYYNKTAITITNPKWVINCTDVDVVINTPRQEVDIAHSSVVNSIIITNNIIVETLNIGGDSVVTLLQVDAGSCLTILLVKACGLIISELTKVKDDSCIDNIGIDTGAVYGGYECVINTALS